MRTLKTTILFCAMLLALGALALQSPTSQDNKEHHGMGKQSVDDTLKMLSEKLNLTEDQQAKVKSILVEDHQQMHAIMDDSSLSQEDKKSKAHSLRDVTHAKIREILNDDQKQKFNQLIQDMKREHSKEGTPK